MLDIVDFITVVLSFIFTILILSYVVGDNPAFRVAVHAFIGVSTGYIFVAILRYVIVDKMILPIFVGPIEARPYWAVLLFLSLPLFTKAFASTEWFGRPWVALLVGVGTAAAIGGAVLGTLFPQFLAATNMFDLTKSSQISDTATIFFTGVFTLLGTIFTLAYFQFTIRGGSTSTGKRGKIMGFVALLGQVFIAMTLGAIFAGVLAASLTAFVDRIQSLIYFSPY